CRAVGSGVEVVMVTILPISRQTAGSDAPLRDGPGLQRSRSGVRRPGLRLSDLGDGRDQR
ncbi:MAG: hypothetical protein ACK56F_23910, partial [bacterium]